MHKRLRQGICLNSGTTINKYLLVKQVINSLPGVSEGSSLCFFADFVRSFTLGAVCRFAILGFPPGTDTERQNAFCYVEFWGFEGGNAVKESCVGDQVKSCLSPVGKQNHLQSRNSATSTTKKDTPLSSWEQIERAVFEGIFAELLRLTGVDGITSALRPSLPELPAEDVHTLYDNMHQLGRYRPKILAKFEYTRMYMYIKQNSA